ncbi:MAG: hypothetical protein O2860_07055 [Chloroflexi bacterium]|nr:hypothetical protein [Chloroflexota bacterium]
MAVLATFNQDALARQIVPSLSWLVNANTCQFYGNLKRKSAGEHRPSSDGIMAAAKAID